MRFKKKKKKQEKTWGFFIILLFTNLLYLSGHSETTLETKVVALELSPHLAKGRLQVDR